MTKIKTKKTKTGDILAKTIESKKLNATQRLAAVEQLMSGYDSKFNIIADELDKLSAYVNNLTRRLNATIQAGEDGGITSDSVKQIIIGENVKDLEGKVDMLQQNGVLSRNDEMVIADNSFIIGREIDDEGNVVNPRLQFLVGSIEQSYKEGLLGKKLGDTYKGKDSSITLEITEIYEVADQNKEQKFENAEVNPDNVVEEAAQ